MKMISIVMVIMIITTMIMMIIIFTFLMIIRIPTCNPGLHLSDYSHWCCCAADCKHPEKIKVMRIITIVIIMIIFIMIILVILIIVSAAEGEQSRGNCVNVEDVCSTNCKFVQVFVQNCTIDESNSFGKQKVILCQIRCWWS